MEPSSPLLENSFLGSKWFNPEYLSQQGLLYIEKIVAFFKNGGGQSVVPFFYHILFFATLFFLVIISYTSIRMLEIRRKEHKHLHHELEEYAHHQAEQQKKKQKGDEISKNPRWVKTLEYLFSQHASDWKLAIIEADSMLETLLDERGFKGENLGEKLKGVTPEKFKNLNLAWEVHNIRNRIAHEGAFFNLSQHEAKRAIAIYEHIFREYGYI